MSLSRQNQVLQSCVKQVIAQAGEDCRTESHLYQKRNYAQGKKMKPADYFYLRLDAIKNDCRKRLQRLRIADEWIEEMLEKQFQICRKNSRGHKGVSKRR